jgi:hypothetical protein
VMLADGGHDGRNSNALSPRGQSQGR